MFAATFAPKKQLLGAFLFGPTGAQPRPNWRIARRDAIKPAFGSHYPGVILTLPAKPHPRIVSPTASVETSFSSALSKPVIISFDGVYWYFKQPDTRPRPDALMKQGDPMKANVRSTDHRELAMEAHQRLPTPISGDCCHALRIDHSQWGRPPRSYPNRAAAQGHIW
jgi:hypothetical protein